MRKIEIYFSENCDTSDIDEQLIHSLLHQLDHYVHRAIPAGELSIAFISDEELAELHGEFLDDSSPTDVMTFLGSPEEDFAGEVCISVDCARREAKERAMPFLEELRLYLVHGWLHLSGLNDLTDQERAQMRQEERLAIAYLES